MRTTKAQRLLLSAFPARFRARYGAELADLVPQSPGGWRVTADLARSAVREWVQPSFCGTREERRRLRLQSTTATVMILWSFSILAAAVFARAVDDHPVPGLHSWGWASFAVGGAVVQLTAAVVLLVGLAYWLRVVVPAWRSADRSTLAFACLPVAVGIVWLAATLVVAFVGHHIAPGNYRHITSQAPTTIGGLTVLAIYGLFTVVCVCVCAWSVVRALARSNLPLKLLAWSTIVAAGVAMALAVVAVAASLCVSRVLMVGGVDARDATMAIASVVALAIMATAATTSGVRGLRELTAAS